MSSSPATRAEEQPFAISGRKLESLDGLRAIAILLVVFHHGRVWIPAVNKVVGITRLYMGFGWIGVDLFFVLSGFLITGILLDTREATNYFRGFYARRALRIFPLYYVTLTALLLLGPILSYFHVPSSEDVNAWLPLSADRWVYFCYLTNWVGLWKQQWDSGFSSMVAHFWSLAVEEQFYLVWPLIVWVAGPRAVRRIAIFLAVVAEVVRLIWVVKSGPSVAITMSTITRMDSLFIGALCASLYRDRDAILKIRKWLPSIFCLCVSVYVLVPAWVVLWPESAGSVFGPLFFANKPEGHSIDDAMAWISITGGYTLLALGFGALVLLCALSEGERTWIQKTLRSRFLVTIGKYSYGIYVFHVPILSLLGIYISSRLVARNQFGFEVSVAFLTLYCFLSFLVAAISYECFEKKILSYKRYFEAEYSPRRVREAAEACEVLEAEKK